MKVYTVHPRHPSYDLVEVIVLIGSGLSWTLLLLTRIWMIWKRLPVPAAASYESIKAGGDSENRHFDVVCGVDEDTFLLTFMQVNPEFLEVS